MNKSDLEEREAAHPFLLGLNEHHIHLPADCAIRIHFDADQIIFREGETANRFYLIESGKVALESSTGDEVVRIDEVGAGDCSAGHGFFHLTCGVLTRAQSK
jgi:CRP-like cAMP-binding protein